MTRAHYAEPVWTWLCDRCGRSSGDFATSQGGLPTIGEMRSRGWHIAKLHGDLCPSCNNTGSGGSQHG